MTDSEASFQRAVAKGLFKGLSYPKDAVLVPVRIELPFPISVNGMFPTRRGRRVPSPRYRAWRDEAGWMLKQQRPAPISGPVTIRIVLVAPDKRPRDGDNFKKGILDLLVKHQIIEADDNRTVKGSSVEWAASGSPCTVEISAI